jgi:hypothetical protein
MDRRLYAQVKLDVVTDVVRIDVRGSLSEESRPSLVHIIRRVRRMGIRSHIRVDLSRADFIESSALAGLRNDLNAIDGATFPASNGTGVSLAVTAQEEDTSSDDRAGERPLDIPGGLMDEFVAQAVEEEPEGLGALGARPLSEYSDDELLTASDSIFSLRNPTVAVSESAAGEQTAS